MTLTIGQKKEAMTEFGVCMPKETIARIERIKGPYLTRGKYILRAVDKMLDQEEEEERKKRKASAAEREV